MLRKAADSLRRMFTPPRVYRVVASKDGDVSDIRLKLRPDKGVDCDSAVDQFVQGLREDGWHVTMEQLR